MSGKKRDPKLRKCEGPSCRKMVKGRFCSSACHSQYYYWKNPQKYRDKENIRYRNKRERLGAKDLKLVLVSDPSQTFIVGHIFKLGQLRNDLSYNEEVWEPGTRFETESGKAVIVRNRKLWYEGSGREYR